MKSKLHTERLISNLKSSALCLCDVEFPLPLAQRLFSRPRSSLIPFDRVGTLHHQPAHHWGFVCGLPLLYAADVANLKQQVGDGDGKFYFRHTRRGHGRLFHDRRRQRAVRAEIEAESGEEAEHGRPEQPPPWVDAAPIIA